MGSCLPWTRQVSTRSTQKAGERVHPRRTARSPSGAIGGWEGEETPARG